MSPVAPTPAGLRSQHLGVPGESLGVMQLGWQIYAPAAAHDLHALMDAEARTDEVHLQAKHSSASFRCHYLPPILFAPLPGGGRW